MKMFLLFSIAFCFIAQPIFAEVGNNLLQGGQIDFSFQMPRTFPPRESSNPPIIFQPDGKILAVGKFSADTQSNSAKKLYRFLPDGRFDPDFDPFYPVPLPRIEGISLQPDGKIVYIYTFSDDENYTSFNVVRLNPDGSRDNTFNYVPNLRTNSFRFYFASFPNGEMWISSSFVERGDFPDSFLVIKINADGSLDQEFIERRPLWFNQAQVLPDGKVLIKGVSLFRLNQDGSTDSTFTSRSSIRQFEVLPDGKILISSNSGTSLRRLFPNGEFDLSFQSEHSLVISQFGVRPNGEILVTNCQNCFSNNYTTRFEVLSPDGLFRRKFESTIAKGNMAISAGDKIYFQDEMFVEGRTVGIVRIKYAFTPTRRKAFDFDGDGKSDIAVYRPSDGVWYIYFTSTNSYNFVKFGIEEDKPVPADYDGDTIADIAVYRPSTGVWYILRSSDLQVSIVRFGLAEDIPTPYDYDGDGKDDISLYRPSNGVWYRLNSSDNSFFAAQFGGIEGDRPIPGDYDGDGLADLAFWRTSTGNLFYQNSFSGIIRERSQAFFETDIATPADFDGDTKTDFAIWKNHNASYYVRYNAPTGGAFQPWGERSDIPVPADYDGDSKDDYAVWRPSTGDWHIKFSTDNSEFVFRFGLAGDIPIPSTFVR